MKAKYEEQPHAKQNSGTVADAPEPAMRRHDAESDAVRGAHARPRTQALFPVSWGSRLLPVHTQPRPAAATGPGEGREKGGRCLNR